MLVVVAGLTLIRQIEKALNHRRTEDLVKDFAALRKPQRRDVIRLFRPEAKD